MSEYRPTLKVIVALLVFVAAFVLALVGQISWLQAAMFMGLAFAIMIG